MKAITMKAIKRAYTRLYSDSGQLTAYVEWADGSRTEGSAEEPLKPKGAQMAALFTRAQRDGIPVTHEKW